MKIIDPAFFDFSQNLEKKKSFFLLKFAFLSICTNLKNMPNSSTLPKINFCSLKSEKNAISSSEKQILVKKKYWNFFQENQKRQGK